MIVLIAQTIEKSLGTLGGKDPKDPSFGPFGGIAWGDTGKIAGEKLGAAFSAIIGLLTVISSLYFIFQLVTGAVQWISSGGEKSGLQQARDKITNGLIGLVIVVASIAIVSVIGTFLGFDILYVASFLDKIQFK